MQANSNNIEKKPVITIREARRLLGKEAKSLNDLEVMEAVKDLHLLAKEHLKKNGVKKSNNSLKLQYGLPKSKSS